MEKDLKENEFILEGNLWKVMISLSWPAILAMVLYGLNNFIDAIFVGKVVGEVGLAGVAIGAPLSQIIVGFGSVLGVGVGSALSIAIGAKDKGTERKLLPNMNFLVLVLTAGGMILGFAGSEAFLKLMGASGETLMYGDTYFRISLVGALFSIYGLAANMIVRAEGKMKTAAIIMATGLVTNIIANYILMVIFDFGVAGAAWGTNIGMLVYTIIGILYFSRKKHRFSGLQFKIQVDKEIIKSILSLGAGAFIMSIMSVIQAVVVMNALAKYGNTYDVAFYGASYRVMLLALTPILGIMRALQPVAGINYGAGNIERVIKSVKIFTVASLALILPFWFVSMISPEMVLSSMMANTSIDPSYITNFRTLMFIIPMLPVVFIGMTFFPSVGNGKPSAIIGMARQVLLYVPVMLIFPRIFGVKAVYVGSLCIDLFVGLLVFLLILKEFKKLRGQKENVVQAQLATE